MIVGGLLEKAAKRLKERWVPGEAVQLTERYQPPEWIKWDEKTFRGDAYPAYSWGVDVVEVSVDPRTYQVKVEGAWSVYDVGKAWTNGFLKDRPMGG
jgi:CO/xanthine dehydrogenase Mo-binding subunit